MTFPSFDNKLKFKTFMAYEIHKNKKAYIFS